MKKLIISVFIISIIMSETVLAAEPIAAYSFEEELGLAVPVERLGYYSNDAIETSSGTSLTYSNGKVGNSLHMNGYEALKLDVEMSTQSYTVSYWINPDRITNCTPTLMITPFGFEEDVFINVALAVDNISPNLWTHMREPYDERYSIGKPGLLKAGEWSHVTIVVDKNMAKDLLKQYSVELDEFTVGAAIYINGYLIDVGRAPNYLCIDSTEYWFGINIWDDLYEGYVDELYIYDKALNSTEIKALYLSVNGDPNAKEPNGSSSNGNERPNGNGSISDDFVEIEQGTINSNNNHLNLSNASPITTQGIETTTNAYADIAKICAFAFTLLSVGFLLQYIKKKRNHYS